jgi:hypothetical protein
MKRPDVLPTAVITGFGDVDLATYPLDAALRTRPGSCIVGQGAQDPGKDIPWYGLPKSRRE